MTETEQMLLDASAALVAARRELNRAIKAAYPVGSYIRWKRGPYIQAGVVSSHHLTLPMLAVRNHSGMVHLHEIATLLEEEAA